MLKEVKAVKLNVVNDEQFLKALVPMVVTVLGETNVTLFKAVQPLNMVAGIIVTPFPRVTLSRALQFTNML